MRRLAALAALSLALAAQAQEREPARRGYAFDSPRIVAEQRLFGIAHGVALLAAACREVPESAAATQEAYGAWRAAQQMTIDIAAAGLARYYFGAAAAAMDWQAIAGALDLKPRIDLAPDSAELQAACATLPQALAQPRYALGERLRREELMAQSAAALAVEAHAAYCRKRLPEAAQAVDAARYELWREINRPLLDQAQAELAAAWPGDAPAASFDEWLAAERRAIRVEGGLADCLLFSEALKQPQAALRNVFNPPPPAKEPTPK